MVAPSLPTELVDAIVDELAHDKDALLACSVLSRQWLVSARRRIFERCIFIGESGSESLGLESPYHRKFRAFVEFLEREAYVCGYFKTLELCCDFVNPEPKEQGKSEVGGKKRNSRPGDPVYHVDAGLLLQVLRKMILLETLELWQVCLEPVTAPVADGTEAPPLPPILNVKRLGLHWMPSHASDLVHIFYLFELLPNVDDVHIVDCTFGRKHHVLQDGTVANERRKMVLPSDTHIEVLKIEDSRTPPFLLSLLDTASTKCLKVFDVLLSTRWRTFHDMYHIKRLVEAAGPTLVDMALQYETDLGLTGIDVFKHACDDLVKPCTNLETFFFHVPFERLGFVDVPWKHLARILQDFTSEKMEVIKVAVYSPDRFVPSGLPEIGSWRRHLPWDALREGFSQEKMKSLKTVRIIEEYEKMDEDGVGTSIWRERKLPQEIQELLKNEFESIASNGVLKFEVAT